MRLYEFTDDEIKIANKTSRQNGIVGSNPIVPAYVAKIEGNHPDKEKREILDFGAGKSAKHAENLRSLGLNVTAHEFGSNQQPGLHDPAALNRKYDHVYASNVLNVQSNKEMMNRTLDQIHNSVKPNGMFTANFPLEPRKAADIDADYINGELRKRFKNVQRVPGIGTKKAPLFHASHPHAKKLVEYDDDVWSTTPHYKKDFSQDIKGWMSPSGVPHLFNRWDEHRSNPHPEYEGEGDSMEDLQKAGFVRFGNNISIHGHHIYLHYDKKHPQGKATALKALRFLKPHWDDPVTISDSPALWKISDKTGNIYRNRKAFKQLGSESTMPAVEALAWLKSGKKSAVTETNSKLHEALEYLSK